MSMRKGILRMALFMAAIYVTATLNAQPWTPAGPDDGNQPLVYNNSVGLSMASDRGKGFYVIYRQYVWSSPTAVEQRASVRRWNGTTWSAIGAPGFSAGTVDYMH